MNPPEWFRDLHDQFTWTEDEHFVTITCRRCGYREYYTHHLNPRLLLQDCFMHRLTARCQGLLPPRPGEQV